MLPSSRIIKHPPIIDYSHVHFSTSHNTPPFNPLPPPLAIAANNLPASMGVPKR